MSGVLRRILSLDESQRGGETSFVLAVNRSFKNQNGEVDADFVLCTMWGKGAENTAKHCGKGSLIGVGGRIQSRTYEREDKSRVYVTEVIGEDIRFIATKRRSNDNLYGETEITHATPSTVAETRVGYRRTVFRRESPLSKIERGRRSGCSCLGRGCSRAWGSGWSCRLLSRGSWWWDVLRQFRRLLVGAVLLGLQRVRCVGAWVLIGGRGRVGRRRASALLGATALSVVGPPGPTLLAP